MPEQHLTDTRQRCLIVEDSRFDQRMMERAVGRTQRAIEVQIVASLYEARKALSDGDFSIILLDNNLPDGKGANFAMELAANEEWADIPVIIVSDWPSPFMWQKAQIAGVDHVVNKTEFNSDLILATLPEPMVAH